MCKRPRPKVVDEQVAAAGEGKAGLAGLHAQDVGVEEGEVGPFVEGGEADFFQHAGAVSGSHNDRFTSSVGAISITNSTLASQSRLRVSVRPGGVSNSE